MKANKIKVFIADNHLLLREGLKHILCEERLIEIAGEADDGIEAIEKIEKINPDISILDISMPKMTGLDAARNLLKYNKERKIIILTRHDNEEYVRQAMNYGVRGYMLKDSAGDDLIKAVKDVMNGNIYLSPKVLTSMVRAEFSIHVNVKKQVEQNENGSKILTGREKEILKLVAEGKSSNEIASLLRISSRTVKVHRLNIMKKLDIHNIPELVRYAIKCELIEI